MNKRIIFTLMLAMAVLLMPRTSPARYLNTDTGRFQTRDVYEGDNEDPLSLHKYLYANANPGNIDDPSGHDGDLISLGVSLGGAASIAAEEAGPTIEAETSAEVSIIESETAEQVSVARSELQGAFESGGSAVGRAFQQFGRLAENTANNVIRTVLNGTKYDITPQPQYGSRFLDFEIESEGKILQMEVKYNLPRSGSALTRLAAQVQQSINNGKGTTIVWSLRPPPPATIKAVQQALGANYSKVVFKSGIGDLVTYLKTFF